MSKSKTTRHALFASATALLLCVAMLIGTTFAWFTDTASTGVNSIQSGTLDVVLEMKEGENWVDAKDKTLEFVKADGTPEGEQILWEPGCTYNLPALRIRNNGNLALKFKIDISKIFGDNELKDAIEWTVKVGGEEATLAAYVGNLTAGSSATLTISGHMKETAGNEYQGKSIDGVGITVVATQLNYEYDSNNNTYDSGAEYPWDGTAATAEELAKATDEDAKTVTIATPELLAAFAEQVNAGNTYENYSVKLEDDIDLNGVTWTPIGNKEKQIYFTGTFDGNGHVIDGLKINSPADSDDDYLALFGAVQNATIKNLTVNGEVSGKNVAGIVARMESGLIENCVSNVNVTDVAGAKAGGIVCLTNSNGCTISNCTNNGTVVGGMSGTGGIVAYANKNTTIAACINNGNIGSANDKHAGGIAGYCTGDSESNLITICKNYGEVTALDNGGGIAAITTNGAWKITYSENYGKVDCSGNAGGILGTMNSGGTLDSCSNNAAVNGGFAGGVVGVTNGGNPEIINCSGGTAAITSPARTLGFTGHSFVLELKENDCAGRILGANGGGGSDSWTKLTLKENADDNSIGTVGICGPYTTWANLEIISGTFYGDPVAGNKAYIKLDDDAVWGDNAAGTYTRGGVTGSTRIAEWTLMA